MRGIKQNWRTRAGILFACFVLAFAVPVEKNEMKAAEVAAGTAAVEVTMTPATTQKLTASGIASGASWSSSNEKVATVDKNGKVTAIKKGKTQITAASNGQKYLWNITVIYGTYKTSDGMIYEDVKGTFGCTGRWFKKSISGGRYEFTVTDGSAAYFKVTGTKYVNIKFVTNTSKGKPYFAYSVDGKSMKRQKINKGKISVGSEKKTHYVRIVIDSISEKENRWGGEAGVGIKSIKPVTGSGVISAIEPQNDVIAFYGDSITQGVRALNIALNPSGTSATNSYAWYCAAQLKCVPYYAGYGGSGIVQPGCFNNLSNVIDKFTAGRKAEAFEADVIVIEHGTNDVYSSDSTFYVQYKNAVKKLHKKHPKAKIVLMIPFTQMHATPIRKAAASCKKYCTVIETKSWKLSYTDGLHPNKSGAQKAGKTLAKKIKSIRKAAKK